jgi:hypothetical protein
MGCDYYIYVYLEIEHINGISYYEFPVKRCYYCDLECGYCDSDVEDEADLYYNSNAYKELYNNMKKMCLTPNIPVVIYDNYSFLSLKFENKYGSIIQDKINNNHVNKYYRHADTGKLTSIAEIIKITKKEEIHDPYESSLRKIESRCS